MASKHWFKHRSCWRIKWRIRGRIHQAYRKDEGDANRLVARLFMLEDSAKAGIARQSEIQDWIERGWISADEAVIAFPGWAETGAQRRQASSTDYDAILEEYEERAIDRSKAHDPTRKTHRNNMGIARQVVRWLSSDFPNVQDLTKDDVAAKVRQMEAGGSAAWTVKHWLTKTRLLIDCAMEKNMVTENVARLVKRPQPKRVRPRIILEPDEAVHILERSLHNRKWINGGLPTACRLGLYAGLRPEEMAWCQWSWLNSRRRLLEVQEAVCDETGERWIPKDWEMREIGVKPELVTFVAEQKKYLKQHDRLGPFMLPGGGARRPDFKNKPLSENAIQVAFGKMVAAEKLNPKITLYSFRHTFITELLRSGKDIRTVQEMAGHSEMKTTESYLHPIRAETQTDGLPY